MFVVKVISPEQQPKIMPFEDRRLAEQWIAGDALKEFEGDIERIELYQTPTNDRLSARQSVENGTASLIRTVSNPVTNEQRERAEKADAIRFLAKLGL